MNELTKLPNIGKTLAEQLIAVGIDTKEKLEEIIKKSEDSKVIKEGIRVGIIGRPNVGKSSLLNSLLEEEKAIVTDVPGTTRDIVEGSLIVSGIPLNIIDTAGIRKTEDTVEKIGVEKSLKIIDTSDLLIYILNNNEEITEEEKEILEKTKNKKRIVFYITILSYIPYYLFLAFLNTLLALILLLFVLCSFLL